MIPARLIRTVPETTDGLVEEFWIDARAMHPGWETVTYRDPVDPDLFPRTSPSWPRCTTGAQLAGLIRLEALWHHGGIYLDSDVEVLRPLDQFRSCSMFAGWEDDDVVPDAILGAEPHHPAVDACIDLALERLHSTESDWRTGNGAWSTGPGVTTRVLPTADSVTLFGPEVLYPVHYTAKDQLATFDAAAYPQAFTVHHWHASWLEG